MLLRKNNKRFNVMKYLFKDLFFQNYEFMKYLIEDDIRWIAVTKVTSRESNDKLIDLYFNSTVLGEHNLYDLKLYIF